MFLKSNVDNSRLHGKLIQSPLLSRSGTCNMDERVHVIYSGRKTLGLTITKDGVLVRAPYGVPDSSIMDFIRKNQSWINKQKQKQAERKAALANVQPLTMEEIQDLADRALAYIPKRVARYALKIGVTYGRITIRNQRTRWGSCSAKGNLNFNCLLMLMPPEVIDSVVVHELCHRKHMDHSPAFYAEIYRVYPDYDKCNAWLKKNGTAVMARMDPLLR